MPTSPISSDGIQWYKRGKQTTIDGDACATQCSIIVRIAYIARFYKSIVIVPAKNTLRLHDECDNGTVQRHVGDDRWQRDKLVSPRRDAAAKRPVG